MFGNESYMIPCFNKKFLGFDCFGCGIQRAFHFLINGDFIEAFKMYPAIYTLIPLFLIIGVQFFFKFKQSNKLINFLAIASVIIIIVSFIIKKFN